MLSLIGAAGGVLLAYWGVTVLRATLPQNLPRLASVAVDLRVLGVTALAAIGTGLLFGTLPALQLARGDVAGRLRVSGRSQTDGAASSRLRAALVTVEVAAAVVLLAGAALFLSSFMRVVGVDLGFNPEHVVSVNVDPLVINSAELAPRMPPGQRAKVDATQTVTLAAVERVKAVPGVVAASVLTGGLPLSGNNMTLPVEVAGRAEPFTGEDEVSLHAVGSGYLDVVRARLMRGRWLADSDVLGSPAVVVLSEGAVHRYFGERDPVGQVAVIDGYPRTVVGVIGDLRLGGPEQDARPEGYVPYLQTDQRNADVVFRTDPDPSTLIPAVVAAVRSVAPKAAARSPETVERLFAGLIEQRKFNMIVLTLFGALAVVIASVGVYGLMAHVVAQRTREIGLRIALGAVPAGILQMVLRRSLVLTLAGIAAGLAIAAALERLVRAFLFRATPHDPLVYAGVAVVLVAAGLVAAIGPARRAARVDPLVALRAE
jgi:predicted permease